MDQQCIEWAGVHSAGYGWSQGHKERAHRLAWKQTHGEIPEGLHVLHKCDNKRCYNIHHLELGTHSKNIQDAYDRGLMTQEHRRGLTDTQFKDVLARCSQENNSALAREYGVSRQLICDIKKGRVTYGA